MSLLRIGLLAIVALILASVLIAYPSESFQGLALMVITLSTASTLIFFAFVMTTALLGFDHRAARTVEQATHTHRAIRDEVAA